jgi:integrase
MASLRKLPSGKYQAQIRLTGVKPITKSFQTQRQAKDFIREVEGNKDLQRALGKPDVSDISFDKLVSLYLDQYSGKDRSVMGRLLWWKVRLGSTNVTRITAFMVDDGLSELVEQGLTGSTCNRYKSTLSSAFSFFIKHKDFKHLEYSNPVRAELITTFSENPAKERFLTDQEQITLLEACKQSQYDKLYLLVLMALTTGARKGELTGLKWSDIDVKTRLATLHTTKNGKPRVLALTREVIEVLIQHREIGDCLVFKSTVNNLRPHDIKRCFSYALKRADITKFRFHDLRHSAASNLARNGASLLEIADVLGHSNTTVTQRYAHLCNDHKTALIDRVMGGMK